MAITISTWATPPVRWISRGPGGGGAFFGPSISPYNPNELYVNSDMSDLFHSTDGGQSWETVDFRKLQGGNLQCWMQYTSNTNVLYGISGRTPMKSVNAGSTWTSIPYDPWDPSVYCLFADDQSTNRVFVTSYSTLYFSTDGGATYSPKFTNSDLHIAGAFWDGANIFIGSQVGLLISTNSGTSFSVAPAGAIGASEAMVSMTGAKQGSAIRLFCVTLDSADVYPGVQGSSYSGYQAIYRLDYPTSTWQRVTNGIAGGTPYFVSMPRNDINMAYVAGATAYPEYPVVYKTTNGSVSWQKVMKVDGNENIFTGWSGDDPGPWNWRKWSYGECALGFIVCPTDPNRAIFTDFGFVHITTNGGTTWHQTYAHTSDQNQTNTPTDKVKSYHGIGIEDTSCWWIDWPDSNILYTCFTDMRGLLSTNGGHSWTFPTSLTYNSTYQTIVHPTNGLMYAAASSVHDLYAWDRYCRDTYIDSGSGEIIYSSDKGKTWQRFKNLGKPVVSLALDPGDPNRLYASMVNSVSGGIYRTTNVGAGTNSTWVKLADPPRTEKHPYLIRVLNDGTVVCSYSARIDAGDFTDSSGVFVSTNNGISWTDRSDAGMHYYTKDFVVDPYDPLQNTWYACVWGEWGNSSGLGGLYMTTNRGINWLLLTTNLDQVGSCAISPWNPNEMYVGTENQGLWYTTNRLASSPTFIEDMNYPFRFPTRIFYNPWNSNEVWITSFGNGMRLGRRMEPAPEFFTLPSDAILNLQAESGQIIIVSRSSDLQTWQTFATNTVLDNTVTITDDVPATVRFYKAHAVF